MLKDLLRYKVDAVRVGGALAAVFLVFLAVAYQINRNFSLSFWDRGYQVKADFVDAAGLANASDVRLAGTYVGQVTDVRGAPGGLGEVTFRVNKPFAPLHQGTHVALRLQTLLGTKYLDITPGPASAPEISADSVIQADKTRSPVDFDQILQSFDDKTRQNLGQIVREAGAATNGRGQDINALLGDLNQLSVQSGPDLQTFADRSQNLDSILTGLDNVGGNLADQRDHLAGVQTHLNQVLGTIADNDPAFKRFISEGDTSLGHGLTQFSGEHQNINTSIAELRPALDKLNPVLVDVDNLAHQFDAFMKIADPLVADILASVSSSNQNRSNTSCDAAVATAGCGGFYLRQPTILANSPADQEKAGAAAASARVATSKSSHSPAPPSFTPSGHARPAAASSRHGAAAARSCPPGPAQRTWDPAGVAVTVNWTPRALAAGGL